MRLPHHPSQRLAWGTHGPDHLGSKALTTTDPGPREIFPIQFDKGPNEIDGDFRPIITQVDTEEAAPKDSSVPASVEPFESEDLKKQEQTEPKAEETEDPPKTEETTVPILPISPPPPPAPPVPVEKATKKSPDEEKPAS